MNIRTYNNISQDQFNTLLGKTSAAGVVVKGNTLEAHGVTIEYTYTPTPENKLVLEITHKAFPAKFVGDDSIFSDIEKAAGLNPNG